MILEADLLVKNTQEMVLAVIRPTKSFLIIYRVGKLSTSPN